MEPGQKRATLIAQLKQTRAQEAQSGPRPRLTPEAVPLSFGQERLWILDQLGAGATYNVPFAVALIGELHRDALERSIDVIVRRHESLRTHVGISDGVAAFQQISDSQNFSLEFTDLTAHAQSEGQQQIAALIDRELRAPLDLRKGPLLRGHLIALAEQEHVLLFTVHHFAWDAWSGAIFTRELSAVYRALVAGGKPELPDLPIQYADFVLWQRQSLDERTLAPSLDFWSRELAGAPRMLELPTDRPRPLVQSHRGAVRHFQIPPDVGHALRALARDNDVTLFMTMVAAFSVFLARCSGQNDICIGTPMANRNRAEVENIIGFFVNTVVLRTRVDADSSFLDLLRRVRATVLAAYEHQDAPFERVVDALGPERRLSHSPLFQVMLAFQNAPAATPDLAGVQLRAIQTDTPPAVFDLTFDVTEDGDRLACIFKYSTDLFDAATIERMALRFQTLLRGLVSAAHERLADRPVLGNFERRQVLEEWNHTAAAYPQNTCIHRLIEQQVARTPEGIALVSDGVEIKYRDLDTRANQLAHYLCGFGVGPEVVVGLCVENPVDRLVGLLAILKAGGAYLPLDSTQPPDRLGWMLNESLTPIVVTDSVAADRLPVGNTYPIVLDPLRDELATQPASPPESEVRPGNLAYVLYTSGSTGRPKGVSMTHGAVVHHLAWFNSRFPLDPGEGVLQKTPLVFDASVWEVLAPLTTGAKLVLVSQESAKDPMLLCRLAMDSGVTTLQLVPSMLAELLDCADIARCRKLRRIFSGGEMLSAALGRRVFELRGPALINLYGPTETCIQTVVHECTPEDLEHELAAPIGRPIWNTQVYVLDRNLAPVPIGTTGELYIAGAQLARGYLGRPDLTAERFIANPFGAPGSRLYRTGDLVRWRSDGTLVCVGRSDRQVKLRGNRIELDDVESALHRVGVAEAAVVVRDDLPGGAQLVAYLGVGSPADVDEVRRSLREFLPDYMLPTLYVPLAEMPKTVSGKLDRGALPAPALDDSDSVYAPPRTPVETAVAEIWAQVLQRGRIGLQDDFFLLGGHSLMATQVISRVRSTYGLELPLRVLFEAPTLMGFAQRIESALPHSASVPRAGLRRRDGPDEPAVLSYAQKRLWFLNRLEPGSVAYNIPAAVRLEGELHVPALGRALGEILRRQEILRTTFRTVDGVPVQVVHEPHELSLDVEDLRSHAAGARERAREEAHHVFDLEKGPLIRVRLLRTAEREHLLLLTLHHIVSDGWSMGVILQELRQLYRAFARGLPSPLPPLELQYADYAAWQTQSLTDESLKPALEYWKQQLVGAPALISLPADHPRPTVQSYRGDALEFSIPASTVARLHELSRRHGCTLFMVLTAAFSVLLSKYSGQSDICIGTPIANRGRAELEGLIGFFVNTLVLRCNVEACAQFSELLAQVCKRSLQAYAHQDMPFERLVDALKPERDTSHAPLFQVMLILQNAPLSAFELDGLSLQPLRPEIGLSKYDLTLTAAESERGLSCELEYSTDLFERQTIERLAHHFLTLLEGIVTTPDTQIMHLPLLTAVEREKLLVEFNETAEELPPGLCVHDLFTDQARRTPQNPAATFGELTFSYGQLNARANQLAHWLRARGAGPDVRIAICIERGLDLLIGLLGVLKAGAAYVPLDRAYPRDRLAYMLGDCAPALLLTEQKLLDRIDAGPVPRFCIDSDWAELAEQSIADPPALVGESHLAYVIYTSGSTGKPKGVMVEHGGVCNFLRSMQRAPGIAPDDVLLAVTSISFDIAGLELFLPLIVGARVVIAAQGDSGDVQRLADLIARHDVTMMQATPFTWQALARQTPPVIPGSLRVLCGGESLSSDLARSLLIRVPEVWNLYGPTETTIWSATHAIRNVQTVPPVGRPIANTQIYILDDAGNPVPPGISGRLFIAGAGVARGYLNRPGLTAERFVADPFGRAGGRMYDTGDLARYRADGILEILGRVDDQLKIRGFRIEPGEIETALLQQPGVREALVVSREDVPGERQLVAYVVPDPGASHRTLGFSLFYFGADQAGEGRRYEFYLSAARYGDEHGFEAVWTPERHFHEIGGLYPNPSVLNAALAATTKQIGLRAGSVVLPLHSVFRVAEEWAVVDNLSAGRVALALASGWHPRDFALAPQSYATRRKVLEDNARQLRALWRGEKVTTVDGAGKSTEVGTFPRPVQPDIPLWITAAGNPQTFELAGTLGANVLTHMLGQRVEQLTEHIARYREARAGAGHDPTTGKVTLMVHTYLGDDLASTVARARAPFIRYMRGHLSLLESFVQSLDIDIADRSPENMDNIVSFAFERYSRSASLIGTPESCRDFLERIDVAGVDEVACLIDWMEPDAALAALPALERLRTTAPTSRRLARELRQALAAQLPGYMVPAAFVPLEAIPRTPNGKVDRKALPMPGASTGEHVYVGPRTHVERELASIWSSALKIDAVSIFDDFFERGGHSLLATQVVSQIRARLGVQLPIRTLFEAPTLMALASAIEEAGRAGQRVLPSPQPAIRGATAPLSFGQERLWFLDQLGAGGRLYHDYGAIHIAGRVDFSALRRSINELVRRHEILRTTFAMVDGVPVERIASHLDLDLATEDLSAVPQSERLGRVSALSELQARVPFDLGKGPLMRCCLVQLGPEEQVLLVTVHHIVWDGWSAGVFFRELAPIYAALIRGETPSLSSARLQHADFAIWQRTWLTEEALATSMSYWKKHLADVPALLAMPVDHPRPAVQSHRGAAYQFELSVELQNSLRALSQREGVTLFMLMLAAYKVLLWRYSSQEDIVIGTPVANRTRAELEDVIGPVMNTLALRSRVHRGQRFLELLREVRETTLEAYVHQDVPFAQVVEALQPQRTLSHAPLFQVGFTFQNIPFERIELPGLTLQPLQLPSGIAKFDLTLMVNEESGRLATELEYSTDLFERATVERLANHFRTLLTAIVAAPDTGIGELPLLSAAERQQLLIEFNATEHARQSGCCVHDLFAEQARRTPTHPAVLFKESSLSYRELNERANQLAHWLRTKGAGPDVRVAICMERGFDMLIALLGVLKSGAAYVPLDPGYPRERLAYMLEDCAPALLLTQRSLLDRTDADAVPRFCLDGDSAALMEQSTADPPTIASERHLAYVIYTSGSTGNPKGVMVEHSGLVNLAEGPGSSLGITANSRVLQFASFSFDACAWEWLIALTNGATLVLATRDDIAPGDPLTSFLRKRKITHVTLPPSALSVMDHLAQDDVEVLITAGEACAPDVAERWSLARPLINAYGPTEATVCATLYPCARGESGTPPIGRPIANAQVHVLDAELQPVPIGVTGEIYVGGHGIARGYLNRSGLTAERFVADPFAASPGSRLYRTGDLARWKPDGNLEYLGRGDHQVKIRGYRVELGEIEAQLVREAGVREAVVAVLQDRELPRLVSYLTLDPGTAVASVREALAASLPEYMVPAHFVVLERLPLTPNGKVDRKALPAPAAEVSDDYVAPRNATEQSLADIFATALRLEKVGVHDDFFARGGHSLLATQVISRMRAAFSLQLPLRTLFEARSIAELAERIDAERARSAATVQSDLRKRIESLTDEQVTALLAEQRRLKEQREGRTT
jgi:amino acid adenylation domain-containing protein/natural product biosynthesis luciferase-like monooxygenase protein